MTQEYIMPRTGEVVPEPDQILEDGCWAWEGEGGTPFPMTGEVGGAWSIYYCPTVSGEPKSNTAWNRFWIHLQNRYLSRLTFINLYDTLLRR